MEEPTFRSLNWLRNAIRYLLEIIAACSFLLLTLGLVSASWNFLDKDAIFGNAPQLQSLWALDQALAIDANLPLTFVVLFAAIRRKDWGIVAIYTVIAVMLLFVSAVILGTESLRQALNVSLEQAATEIHVPVELLTLMRSGATIGLVAMSGLNLTMVRVHKDKEPEPKTEAHEPELTPTEDKAPTTPPSSENVAAISNGHSKDKYQKYLAAVSVNPEATREQLAKELGVSVSSVSLYRRKARNERDGLEILQPTSPETIS